MNTIQKSIMEHFRSKILPLIIRNIIQALNGALTTREAEIAAFLVKGVTPPNISRELCISITTVNKHIANMHAKLNVSTRQELIVKLLNS